MSSGHLDLIDPFFSLYFGMRDACAVAARQQWASEGIYIPEVTFFSGPEPIPESLVAEFQDLFLARRPYAQASREFLDYVQTKNCLTSRYNFLTFGSYVNGVYVAPDKGAGIFGHCTHFLSGAADVAALFWQRYEFTGNRVFLRDRAYPMIKGVAEFYAHFPNLKKESDGKYHIYHVNRIESDWDSQDTPSELGAMRTIFPMVVRASKVLGVDESLRLHWQEIADNLAAPAPGSGNRGNFDQTKGPYSQRIAAEASAASGLPIPDVNEARPQSRPPAPTLAPTSGASRPRVPGVFGNFVARGDGAIEPLGAEAELKRRFLGFNMAGGFIDPAGDGGAKIFRNRLRLREGPGAIDAEHLGGLAFGIHQSLLMSTTNETLTESTIEVFPAWPKDWSVNFKLLARGGTTVTAAQQDGKVVSVKLEPTRAATIAFKNPWTPVRVKVLRGTSSETLSGETLNLAAKPGETIQLSPE
jgi:hypothetical protein